MFKTTATKLIIYSSITLVLLYNYTFFTNVFEAYDITHNIGFLISLCLILVSLFVFLLSLLCHRYTTKPILILIFIVSSMSAYFMDTYHIVIDESMIRNTLQTDMAESMDLFSIKQLLYLVFLGILPSFVIYKLKIQYPKIAKGVLIKFLTIAVALIIIAGSLFLFSKHYTSFFREHKPLRYSANPAYWMYSIGDYISKTINNGKVKLQQIGLDATRIEEENDEKYDKDATHEHELVIMVVGEALRADHLSINGYKLDTTPKLSKQNIINLPNVYSCGTSTAVSVPCMFSIIEQITYSYKKGRNTENVLDVLTHTKDISVLWRDNNSDSKGVALRVESQNYKTPELNTICDETECRDEGMLVGLKEYIATQKNKDILIVLHQMGNHGPAYYKRYPKEFEKFTPVCRTNQLEKCTQEEISNAYDNAVLYTDTFLSKTIDFLKTYDKKYETTMIYMSDHGESLGENGVYIHGLPYFMAPDAQTHVASFMWFGEQTLKEDINISKVEQIKHKKYSQDNLFHTLLGLFEINSTVYNKSMDILH